MDYKRENEGGEKNIETIKMTGERRKIPWIKLKPSVNESVKLYLLDLRSYLYISLKWKNKLRRKLKLHLIVDSKVYRLFFSSSELQITKT